MIPDILETTPSNITRKQGGNLWIVNTLDGLLYLSAKWMYAYIPITVFVREKGCVRAHVLWMHPAYEFSSDY